MRQLLSHLSMRFPFVRLAARHSRRVDGPGASTPGYVKLLLPARHSRSNSHFALVALCIGCEAAAAGAIARRGRHRDEARYHAPRPDLTVT
jgi:hypothetical protein